MLAKYEELDAKAKEAKSRHDILMYMLAEDRDRLRSICADNAEDASMDQLYINSKLEECNRRLSTYCIDKIDEEEYQRLREERDNALLAYRQSASEYNASLRKYRQNIREFKELKMIAQSSEQDFIEENLDEIQNAALQLPTRKYCCVPMETAMAHHCPWAAQNTRSEDTTSKENLLQGRSQIQDIASDRAVELQKYHQFLQEEHKRVLALQEVYDTAEKNFDAFSAEIKPFPSRTL